MRKRERERGGKRDREREKMERERERKREREKEEGKCFTFKGYRLNLRYLSLKTINQIRQMPFYF